MADSDTDKIIGVQRLLVLAEAFTQLRSQKCASVQGNPVSIVPVFALETLYALEWGGISQFGSLTDSQSVKFEMNIAIITLDLKLTISNRVEKLKIVSKWTQDETNPRFTVENRLNEENLNQDEFPFSNEKEKIDRATDLLKRLAINAITRYFE